MPHGHIGSMRPHSHNTLCAANRGGLFCGETRISSDGSRNKKGRQDRRSGFGDFVKGKPMDDARKHRCYSAQSRKSRRKLTLGGRPTPTAYRQIRKEQDRHVFAFCARSLLKSNYDVVGKPHHDHVAVRSLLTPCLGP